MLQNAWALKGFTIQATDGKVGHVDDFYFDDITWVVRYVVVDTGNWLGGHEVLLSPVALSGISQQERCFNVSFARDHVSGAPDVESDRPVTRQWEAEYHDYFGWPYYWEGAGLFGAGPYPGFATEPADFAETEAKNSGDPHLQSARDVGDCSIAASDGDIGHVIDFIIDEDSWVIRYVEVDTGNWLPGKKVLLPTRLISEINWSDGCLKISLPREVIEHAPPYDPDQLIGRDYEQGLFDYYQEHLVVSVKPYWEL
ncbi:MAG: PRC-barrel domain-containing protein, partial [Abditibacteriaceae bacterium]